MFSSKECQVLEGQYCSRSRSSLGNNLHRDSLDIADKALCFPSPKEMEKCTCLTKITQ